MPKHLTVFYSWQSDTPSNLNRTFIEKALQIALERLNTDAALEPAIRSAGVQLDKDTKGVAGSPAVAETIFRKIDECAVFVADLTFVGRSTDELVGEQETPRLFPNPNVLIEYGYARKCHGNGALIAVMNSAYGDPSALPFDLSHLRWPITYRLKSGDEKPRELETLAGKLVEALRLILSEHPAAKPAPPPAFSPRKPTGNPAAFWQDEDVLIASNRWAPRMTGSLVPNDGRSYLRLYSTHSVGELDTELDAEILAREGGILRPMGHVEGWSPGRNQFGAIIYEGPQDGKLLHFTQLFLTREIWGVDARCLNRSELHTLTKGQFNGYIAGGAIEEIFVDALTSYLSFAQKILKSPAPLRVEAGLVGVNGYPIAAGDRVVGECVSENVIWRGEVGSYEVQPHEVLTPFFELVFKKCGVRRPESRQIALEQQFGRRGS